MPLGTSVKVMVVDDSATMRRIIKGILYQIGFNNVVEADDGTTALELLRKQKVDLIISDWNMPKMPGIELLKAIRSDESLKDIKFIMVTAEAQKESVLEAIRNGVNQYIVKPFTPETLREKLEKVLGS